MTSNVRQPLRSTALNTPIEHLKKILSTENLEVEWLAGDGSDRSYFRILLPDIKSSHVLMQLSPAEGELLNCDRYDCSHN